MSAASEALNRGLSELLGAAGETLMFRFREVTCSVNRVPEDPEHPGHPNFSMRSVADIEVATAALRDQPVAGEVFTSADGESFRVKKVTYTGHSYLCRCDVS